MNYTVQRFVKGHPLYSEVAYKGCTPVFGRIVDADGTQIHYTMERRETLIPEGEYEYCFYYSPTNGWVILLKNVPGFTFIEHHIANWPNQIKGCTAHGLKIDVRSPQLVSSKAALTPWFESIVKASGKVLAGDPGTIIDGKLGRIKYETLQQAA